MATVNLLRACARGSRFLLVQTKVRGLPVSGPLAHNQLSLQKAFSASPSLAMLDYFRARRGPFTPEEKRGSGHMMMASTHWTVERAVMISMIGIMPACLFYQAPIMDHLLSTSIFLHGYWGVHGVLTDYLVKFIPFIHIFWYAMSILAFAGLIHFNYNDIGVCNAIAMLWHI